MNLPKDLQEVVRTMYDVSVDDIIAKYGSVGEAAFALHHMGQTRLFNKLLLAYPKETALAVVWMDDIKLFEEIGGLSILEPEELLVASSDAMYERGDLDANILALASERYRDQAIELSLRRDDYLLFILAQGLQPVDDDLFMEILDADAVNVYEYVLSTQEVNMNILLYFDAGASGILSFLVERVLDDNMSARIVRGAIIAAHTRPSLNRVALAYLRRHAHDAQLRIDILEDAVNHGNMDLLNELQLTSEDSLDISIVERALTREFVDYLIGINPSLAQSIAESALFEGVPEIIEYLGYNPRELLDKQPRQFLINLVDNAISQDNPFPILYIHSLDPQLLSLAETYALAVEEGAQDIIEALEPYAL